MQELETKRFLSLDEVVQLSGLSASTLRRRVRDGSIVAVQPGGRRTRLLFDAESLGGLVTPGTPVDGDREQPKPDPKRTQAPRPPWRDL